MKPDIKLELDLGADAAYVVLSGEDVASTRKVDPNRLIDVDARGKIIGIEFLHVSGGVDLKGLPYRDELHHLFDEHHIKQFA